MKYFSGTILGVLGFSLTVFILTTIVDHKVPDDIKEPRFNELQQIDHLGSNRGGVGETYDTAPLTNRQMYFNKNRKFLLWIGAIAMGVALSLAMLPWLWSVLSRDLNDRKVVFNKYLSLALALLGSGIVFFFAHFQMGHLILLPPHVMSGAKVLFTTHGHVVLLMLVGMLFLAPLFSLAGNFMIHFKVSRELDTIKNIYSSKELIHFKETAFKLLLASSLMLVFGIITSSLLRETIIGAVGQEYGDVFPKDFVLAYGGTFTFFLILFYAPGFFILNHVIKQRLADKKTTDEEDKLLSIYSNKESIEVLISILAPVVSSILLEVVVK